MTDASFDADVLKSDKPVLVDFWAPWCAPVPAGRRRSSTRSPPSTPTRSTIVKLNTDENPAVTARYGVTALPTLDRLRQGRARQDRRRRQPKPMLLREFSAWLG